MASNDEDTIIALLREQEAALARGDARGAVAMIDRSIISYDLPPPLEYRGSDQRHIDGLNDWFAPWESGVTTELARPVVLIEGDLAVVHGLSRMQGTERGGSPIDSWNRRTIVLRRMEGDWRIVHEHSSYPMAMDGSGKAVTDLKPHGSE